MLFKAKSKIKNLFVFKDGQNKILIPVVKHRLCNIVYTNIVYVVSVFTNLYMCSTTFQKFDCGSQKFKTRDTLYPSETNFPSQRRGVKAKKSNKIN